MRREGASSRRRFKPTQPTPASEDRRSIPLTLSSRPLQLALCDGSFDTSRSETVRPSSW